MGKSAPMKSSSSKSKGHISLNYSSPPSERGTADAISKNTLGCVFDQAGSQTIANHNPLLTSFITQMAMAQMAALQQHQQLLQQPSSEHAVADGNKNLLQKKIMEAAMGQYSPMIFNPFLAANPFANLFNTFSQTEIGNNTLPIENGESLEPKAKRPKTEQAKSSANSNNTKAKKAPEAVSAANQEDLMRDQLASLMGGTGNGSIQVPSFPASNPFASQGVDFTTMLAAINNSSTNPHSSSSNNNNSALSRVDGDESPQQKRARTRITDDQLKVLRQYFDINNSPSEEQVKEMSHKAQLPEKVIKHWFRNTLFKERQRDKDSPYNFSVPPQLTIDLATYEKTGEAKVTPLKVESGINAVGSATTTPGRKPVGDRGDDPRQQASLTKATPSPTSRSPSISSNQGRSKLVMSAASRTIKRERDDDETSIEHTPSPTTPLTSNLKCDSQHSTLGSTGTAEDRNFLEQWQKIMAATNMMTGCFSMSPTFGYSGQGVPGFNPALFFGGGAIAASVAASERPASRSTDNNNKQSDLSALLASSTAAPPTLSNATSAPLFTNFLSSVTRQPHCQKGNLAQSAGASSSSRNTPQPGSLSSSPLQQPKAATSVSPPPPPPPPHSMASSTSVLGGGRRANRTRFTDFQLKTLQNFFDRQAYPKDDDLEALSKKLGLSPRVIVVWFQNARQKARKIFENNPVAVSAAAAAAAAMAAGSSHPATTIAHLVHQQGEQRHAGKPTASTATTEESLSEEEKNTPLANGKAENPTLAALFGRNSYESAATVASGGNEGGGGGGSPAANLMALLSASGSLNFASLNGCSTTGQTKRETTRQGSAEPREIGANTSNSSGGISLHKGCPFCTHAYNTRDGLVAHISRRHPEQGIGDKALDFLSDTLPNCMVGDEICDAEHNRQRRTHEVSGQERSSQNDKGNEDEDDTSPLDLSRPTGISHSPPPHSPRSPSNVHDEEEEGEDNHSREASIASESRMLSPSTRRSSSLGSQRNIGGIFQHHSYHHQRPGSRGSSKRYRTHLTPIQVFVMKCVFNDYKTPSMGECDSLGRQIGLHKRVVQVWFQNARAKMRKSRGEEEAEDLKALPSIGSMSDARECELCTVDFAASGTTMQEHLLSDTHINNIQERGALLRGATDRAESESHGEYDEPTQNRGHVVGDAEPVGMGKHQENHERNQSPNSEDSHSSPLATNPFAASGQIPFNLAMLPSQVMLFGDPTLYGTPIKLLQIPTAVQERITSELKSGSDSCKFTQDGLQLSQLAKKISAGDFKTASASETEVGEHH